MVFRIFDCVLANGIEAIFGFSIVLLEKNEEQLLAIKFDQILEYLKMALFDTYRIERVDEGELGRGLGGPMSPNTEMDMAVRDITNGASKSKSKQARSINIVSPATAISSGVSGEEDGEAEVARPSYDVDRFVQDAFQVKVSPFMLDSYGAEWEDLRRAANKHAMEMDGLRNANRQLTAQVSVDFCLVESDGDFWLSLYFIVGQETTARFVGAP